jgi:hypothetical protein
VSESTSKALEQAKGASFSSLVADHGADVPPRAVLDELLRVGAVDHLEDGRLRLVERAYIPQTDEDGKLEILGTDVADLLASIEHMARHDRDVGGKPDELGSSEADDRHRAMIGIYYYEREHDESH